MFNLQVLPTNMHFLPKPYLQIPLMAKICEMLILAIKLLWQPHRSKHLRLAKIQWRRIILIKLLSNKEELGWLRRME